ncbi:polysaccharide pyruvyl transferase family protein [Companilactobacillus insicii]|uniref:polysaccharide pyruvyl transferase family protein n=1 Tax=Companilactobacillus insicii TaxID=1732567 RepID=UPI001FEC0419|nr:polysaccharide pyruvyl transferase family protein [Companilactobacillus insicii]
MQRIVNYGSFLQAYALKKILEEEGADVEFVDYHVDPPVIGNKNQKGNNYIRKIKKGLGVFKYDAPLLHKIKFILYKKNFSKKNLPILGISNSKNYNPKLDCLVIGSDEVFNCIQRNPDVGYSLELFGKNNNSSKLISYAASFGNTTIDKLKNYGKCKEVGELLDGFDTISVRDSNSANIVKTISTNSPVYNVDPVLAYDYLGCNDLVPKIKQKEKYLLLYAYSGRITNIEANWISVYAREKNLKVYAIGGIQKCADRFISCSPFEVLSYFENADEVITDTFHGSIFSIITHKRFTTLIRKSVGSSYGNEEKLTDLLHVFNLEERMTTSIEDVGIINRKKINYDTVDKILNVERRRTRNYLRREI